jgi:hypothetical protein
LDLSFGAYLLPAALLLGAPETPGTHEKGLFCDSVDLVERVVELAERGANPIRVVSDVNTRLAHVACIYAVKPDVRARTVRFEKTIAANHTSYAIYRVEVTSYGVQPTEIGDIEWKLSQPITMYTLRAAPPARTVSH